MDIPILYEDASVIVVNKPAGILVFSESKVEQQTIKDWAEKKYQISNIKYQKEQNLEFVKRAGIVHRLDKETSGCLIIAKDPISFEKLQMAFKNRLVKKTYIALVHGKLIPEIGEIKAPIDRIPGKKWRLGIVPTGKEAITKYKRIRNYAMPAGRQELRIKNSNEIFTLVELYPETGRTHQLRIHLKYIGFPIVGDYLYAGSKKQKEDRRWCGRVFLHCAKLTFPHPVNNKDLVVEAPLSSDLLSVLDSLTLTGLR